MSSFKNRVGRLERAAAERPPEGEFGRLADAAEAEFSRRVPDVLAATDAELKKVEGDLFRRYGRAPGMAGFVRGMLREPEEAEILIS